MSDTTAQSPSPNAESDAASIDTSVPHSARVWNYWLSGKDNYAVDREVGERLRATLPEAITSARADREFLERSVRYLVEEAGIRQFLDIGTGLPTNNNTHEVAQGLAPETRVVYVDNDPVVLLHARALLTSTAEGATDYLHADVRDPETIVSSAAATLDLTRPVAVVLSSVLNYVVDNEEAGAIVDRLVGAVPAGSHLVVGHPTADVDPDGMAELLRVWNAENPSPMTARSHREVAELFHGLDLVEPGVVPAPRWRPTPGTLYAGHDISHLCVVGRKA